jgi:molybdopterin-guanine dinucleotide biosynthesis protein A
VFAAVLVGGRGRRLGGVEKALMRIGNKKIIEHILESLKEFDCVIVCRDEEQSSIYSKYESTITDILKGMGPLGGIHAALKHFNETVLVVSSDMPFLNPEVCRRIYDECWDADAVIPVWNDGRLEPTFASYSPKLIPEIERCFKSGEKKVLKAIEGLERVKYYPVEKLRRFDKDLLSFMNVNTGDDLAKAEEIRRKKDLGSV